ncbi:hypothetical protein PLESTM_001763700 [Pleodorina starrii]|nr:hypothetical protein PLESTM_001763700 [Pleodorina starrii]
MNALLLRNLGGLRRSSSLQSFSEYRQAEAQNPQMSSVTSEGTLLEYETLELRIHPPNVVIDNDTYDDMTVITIDSANRPGTLIEVVQCLTELGLSIRCARISSDGGWFVDEFFVTESPKGKLLDARKIDIIRKVLSVETDNTTSFKDKDMCTVFELAGRDRHGLLAAVLQLLVVNGCEVLSAAVWTFHDRVALVISATERGAPVVDPVKLDRLEQILYDMLGSGDAVVNSELVRGEVHHERRLHHLLLLEELKAWEQQYLASTAAHTPTHATNTPSQNSTQTGAAATPTSPQPAAAATATPDGDAAAAAAAGLPPRPPTPPGGGGGGAFFLRGRGSVSAGPSAPPSALPSRAPSPAPGLISQQGSAGAAAAGGLHAENSGSVGVGSTAIPGYTPAGFPQADEGGAACPQAAALAAAATSGGGGGGAASGGDFTHEAPAGPFDLLVTAAVAGGGLARCASGDGPLGMMVSEPMIDVGLDLPAAVQLKDQVAVQLHDRRRSTTGPDHGAAASLSSPSNVGGTTAGTAVRCMERSVSNNALQGGSASGGGGGAAAAAGPPVRNVSGRCMTVTGDESETGQPALAPAPTATAANVGGADGAGGGGGGGTTHDQLAPLRRSEVCTLADMNYDIYHATIDSEGDAASQLFYVRPRYGECIWDERRAAKLRYMLESAVQRRFPRGTKVCVQSGDRSALVNLFSALSTGGFWITRADVRTHQESAMFEFTITDTRGQLPEQSRVQSICEAVGGIMTHDVYGPSTGPPAGTSRLASSSGRGGGAGGGGGLPPGAGKFRFSILERRWNKGWGGGQGGGVGSYDSMGSGSM